MNYKKRESENRVRSSFPDPGKTDSALFVTLQIKLAMFKRRLLSIVLLTLISLLTNAQGQASFSFALVTDTHVGGSGADEDLRKTVKDINYNDSLSFIILSGDITEFGSDRELKLARQILDSLNKPWYIIPGNHDTKWSESGANSFRTIFGSESFAFRYQGYLFIGTNSGPNMRMGPGQIPRENIVWLDSVLNAPENMDLKIISVNHYPLDERLNNWFELTDRLKKHDVRLELCGHGHSNRVMNFEGIPAIMGRSNLRAGREVGGYNILKIEGDTLLTASVKEPGHVVSSPWCNIRLINHEFSTDSVSYGRPDYSVNERYPLVKEQWRVQLDSDIGSGMTLAGKLLIVTGTDGFIRALDLESGIEKWRYPTGAKIYSTPVTDGERIFAASSSGWIFALNSHDGTLLWRFDTGQPVVSSPVMEEGIVYLAGSSGCCFALKSDDGQLVWKNNQIDGFVETTPLIYKDMLIFGTWNNHLYSLDINSGTVRWRWDNGYNNRMLSPAACVPVGVNNKIFVVAPDRKMTCINAGDGTTIWQSDLNANTVRESMGITADSSMILAKTMDGNVIGVSSMENEGRVVWKAAMNAGYDIAPAVITESGGIVFVPTDKGFVYAVKRADGNLSWVHRVSSCLVNQILPVTGSRVALSTMDGIICLLDY